MPAIAAILPYLYPPSSTYRSALNRSSQPFSYSPLSPNIIDRLLRLHLDLIVIPTILIEEVNKTLKCETIDFLLYNTWYGTHLLPN